MNQDRNPQAEQMADASMARTLAFQADAQAKALLRLGIKKAAALLNAARKAGLLP